MLMHAAVPGFSMGSGTQTQLVRLEWQALYTLSHLPSLRFCTFMEYDEKEKATSSIAYKIYVKLEINNKAGREYN